MRSHDYNVFVLGPDASGKSAAVRSALTALAAEAARLRWISGGRSGSIHCQDGHFVLPDLLPCGFTLKAVKGKPGLLTVSLDVVILDYKAWNAGEESRV